MSIALWRLNYVQSAALNTPSEAKKALYIPTHRKLFLLNEWRCCGHWQPPWTGSPFFGGVGTGAWNGNRRSITKWSKSIKISPAFSAGRSYWGWWLAVEQPPKHKGRQTQYWPAFFLRVCIVDVVAPTNEGSDRVKMRARKRSNCLPFFRAGRCCADERTVERRLFQPTGTAERNKGSDRRETALFLCCLELDCSF